MSFAFQPLEDTVSPPAAPDLKKWEERSKTERFDLCRDASAGLRPVRNLSEIKHVGDRCPTTLSSKHQEAKKCSRSFAKKEIAPLCKKWSGWKKVLPAKLSSFEWLNKPSKQTELKGRQFHAVCVFVADPATFSSCSGVLFSSENSLCVQLLRK